MLVEPKLDTWPTERQYALLTTRLLRPHLQTSAYVCIHKRSYACERRMYKLSRQRATCGGSASWARGTLATLRVQLRLLTSWVEWSCKLMSGHKSNTPWRGLSYLVLGKITASLPTAVQTSGSGTVTFAPLSDLHMTQVPQNPYGNTYTKLCYKFICNYLCIRTHWRKVL